MEMIKMAGPDALLATTLLMAPEYTSFLVLIIAARVLLPHLVKLS